MNNRPKCAGLFLLQAVMRLIFVILVYFAVGGNVPYILWPAAALLFFLGLMPGRFALGAVLSGTGEKAPWGKRVAQGLLRFFRGAVFALPLCAVAGYLIYALENLPFNKAGQIIQNFSAVVFAAPSVDTGILGVALVLAVLAVVAVIGWRRDLAMEYLPGGAAMTNKQLVKGTAALRKAHRGTLAAVGLQNVLIAVPAIAMFALVLVPYVWGQLSMAGSNRILQLQMALQLMKKPLPAGQVGLLAAVYGAVYVPLHALRKMRIAKKVRKISKG